MKLGIISDTHGFLDPRVEKIFAGVDHIIHAGDIGDAMIELELKLRKPRASLCWHSSRRAPFSSFHFPRTRQKGSKRNTQEKKEERKKVEEVLTDLDGAMRARANKTTKAHEVEDILEERTERSS